ncbi:MAG: Gfo/Idh/MocA family oxidoreductase [Chloroflexi bacterium]|nr:Gfo/Idh/MocA family oxidoreductase [Chloroflexota bacterium]
MTDKQRVRLAVIGGRRGASFAMALQALQEQAELTSVCDLSEGVLDKWREDYPGIRTFTSYEALLESDVCNAVFLATPLRLHARQAVEAMRADKHVLSEVVAATTVDECWQLIEMVEKTGKTYMLAENYCYMRPNMMVRNMADQGVFGATVYAEGAYIHDCRELLFDDRDQLTWRGELRRSANGNTYPTHSLGPVAQWLGAVHGGRDRLVSVATWMSPTRACELYAAERFGPDHPAAQKDFWCVGDSGSTLLQCESGAVIYLRVDWASARPHNMTHYVLQGTRAGYLSARRHHQREDNLIWIDGMSPGSSPSGKAEWEALEVYKDRYEHPYWREWGELAEQAGHGGGDFFVLKDFFDAVLSGARPAIDVYDAVTWSSVFPLSALSVQRGSAPVDIPRFDAASGE